MDIFGTIEWVKIEMLRGVISSSSQVLHQTCLWLPVTKKLNIGGPCQDHLSKANIDETSEQRIKQNVQSKMCKAKEGIIWLNTIPSGTRLQKGNLNLSHNWV